MTTVSPLAVDGIFKSFGTHEVLKDISFSLKEGSIFGLVGLNGAGKTTLIKIILGLLQQDTGSATIFNQSCSQTETRRQLAFLPEKFHPSIFLKGNEFLSLTLSYFKKSFNQEAAEAVLKQLDLDPKVLDSKISKYSKGMGQKLGLASAFLTEAPLLILDEPMSGLDPRARIALKDTLIKYAKNKRTIFFSSHILSDIDEICDQIAVIHNNRIIYTGSPAKFKEKYKNDNLERAFLQAIGNS